MPNGKPRTIRPDHYLRVRERTHVLYRCYARHKVLLYVGITNHPEERLAQHRADKPWWKYVDHITLQNYPSRKHLIEAEAVAIREENPTFNIVKPVGVYAERRNYGRQCARLWPEASNFGTSVPEHNFLLDYTLEQQLYPCVECHARAIYCEGDTVACGLCSAEWSYDQWFAMTFYPEENTPGQLSLPM